MFSNAHDSKTEQLTLTALMMGLILIGTMLLRIPIPMTQGYVHLGDTMIFLGVMTLGRRNGAAAAGVGSAMADVLGGFAMWAPWTLAIKYLMAFITGLIIEHAEDKRRILVPAMIAGGIFMTLSYFAAERVMYGSWAAAALGIPWNTGQFAVGIILSLILNHALKNYTKRAE